MWTTGGEAQDGLGGMRAEPGVLCGICEESGERPHLGTGYPDGDNTMFQLVGLENTLEKTKALVCTSGYIWGKWSEAAYKRKATE